jgi:hypothetical protein
MHIKVNRLSYKIMIQNVINVLKGKPMEISINLLKLVIMMKINAMVNIKFYS